MQVSMNLDIWWITMAKKVMDGLKLLNRVLRMYQPKQSVFRIKFFFYFCPPIFAIYTSVWRSNKILWDFCTIIKNTITLIFANFQLAICICILHSELNSLLIGKYCDFIAMSNISTYVCSTTLLKNVFKFTLL